MVKSVKITLCVDGVQSGATSSSYDKHDAFFEAKDTMRQIADMARGLGAAVQANKNKAGGRARP